MQAERSDLLYSCVICGTQNNYKVIQAVDHRYGNSGLFEYRCCRACGAWSQHPVPDESRLGKYYPAGNQYYAFQKVNFAWPSGWRGEALNHLLARKGYNAKDAHSLLSLPGSLYYRVAYHRLADIPSKNWGQRYLDFGSGAMGTVALMQRLGWVASGLDVSEEAVKAGRELGLDIHLGTAATAPWPNESFDFIYSHHSYEHVPNPEETLRGLYRLLRPGGGLMIVQPDAGGLCAKFGSRWGDLSAPLHVHLHTKRSMRILYDKSGFYVENMYSRVNPADILDTIALLLGSDLRHFRLGKAMRLQTFLINLVCTPLNLFSLGNELVTLARKP